MQTRYKFIDPLEVLKTLKQMIRVFHFAKINTKYKTDLHFFERGQHLVVIFTEKFIR